MVLGRPEDAPSIATQGTPAGGKSRGLVKRWQVESFAVILRQLTRDKGRCLHVVDFGCGTGTLLLPLAWLFPHCRFTGVEMKPAAVALLTERARAAGLRNVVARRCMIEQFTSEPFDVALALHACGNATDAAMQLAARRRAAYLVSPCCVGKLKFSLAGGSSFSSCHHVYTPHMPGERPVSRAAAAAAAVAPAAVASEGTAPVVEGDALQGAAHGAGAGSSDQGAGTDAAEAPGGGGHVVLGELRHPRSRWLREHLPDPEANFRIMAKVADQNHSGTPGQGVTDASGEESLAAAAARACKAHVELDRNLAAREKGYRVGLFKCFQWQSMAKNDLLVGLPAERSEWAELAGRLGERLLD